MKLYKIPGSGLTPRLIDLDGPSGPRRHIYFGDQGEGSTQVDIPILGDAGDDVFPQQTPSGLVLSREDWTGAYRCDDGSCLAIINALGHYAKGRQYDIGETEGVVELARGRCSYGAGMPDCGAPVILAKVLHGGTFTLGSYRYGWGNGWEVRPSAARRALVAR